MAMTDTMPAGIRAVPAAGGTPDADEVVIPLHLLTIDVADIDLDAVQGVNVTLTGPGTAGVSIVRDADGAQQIILATTAQTSTDANGQAAFELLPSEAYIPGWPRSYTLSLGTLTPTEFEMPAHDLDWTDYLISHNPTAG